MKRVIILFTVIFFLTSGLVFASEKGSTLGKGRKIISSTKAGAQAAILKHLQHRTCKKGGCSLGNVKAEFDYLHGGIKKKGAYYISCVDFIAGGDTYDVDYYVQNIKGRFKVKKEVLHKKNGEIVNKILWKWSPEDNQKGSQEKGSTHEHKGSGH